MMRGFSPWAIADQAFDLHLVQMRARLHRDLELVGDRQKEQIGEADAVHGGGEGRGDAVAELGGIVQVLHHRHQAEHRADDAQRRRVDAHALEHLGGARVGRFARVHVDFERAADGVGLAAIDHQLQSLAQEGIGLRLRSGARAPAVPGGARCCSTRRSSCDQRSGSCAGGRNTHGSSIECPPHDLHRRLHADRRHRADDHDHECGRGDQRVHAGALEDRAQHDRDAAPAAADDAEYVHAGVPSSCHSLSRAFSRSSACPCSWQTRDSVTLSTAPISLRLSSCS